MTKIKIAILLVLICLMFLVYLFSQQSENNVLKHQEKNNEVILKVSPSEEKNKNSLKNNDDKFTVDIQPKKNIIPKLNIQLYGLVPSKDKKLGYAFISYNETPLQVYDEGDYLSKDVLLKSLSAKEMIIDNHGKLEKYLLKNKEDSDKLSPKPEKSKLDSNTPPIRSELLSKSLPINSDRPPEIIKPIKPKDNTPPPPDGGKMPGPYD